MHTPISRTLWFFRFSIWGLLVFEFLNWVGIMHVPLDFSWHGLIITSLLWWIFTEIILHYEKNIRAHWVLPFIVLIVYMDALWDIFHFYSSIHPYDKFLHFIGSAVLAFAVYELLKEKLAVIPKTLSIIIFISLGSSLWMLYEIEEYLEDLFINHRLLRMGDSFDTGWDLLMDMLGCIFIVTILSYYDKNARKQKSP